MENERNAAPATNLTAAEARVLMNRMNGWEAPTRAERDADDATYWRAFEKLVRTGFGPQFGEKQIAYSLDAAKKARW